MPCLRWLKWRDIETVVTAADLRVDVVVDPAAELLEDGSFRVYVPVMNADGSGSEIRSARAIECMSIDRLVAKYER